MNLARLKLSTTLLSLLWMLGLGTGMAHATDKVQKLVYCSEGGPDYFAPSLSRTATSSNINNTIYETLVTHVRGETKLAPGLAEYWQISEDLTQYTFFLRRGVKWHSNSFFKPKRHFNADDVIFMLERQWKHDHPFHNVSDSSHHYFKSAGLDKLIQSINKVDNHTVTITLKEPSASFLSILTQHFSAIQNKDYATAMLKQGKPEIIDQHPIGTGPFSFVRYDTHERVSLKTFIEYWRGRAKIDTLEFLIAPNASDRWQMLQNGQCHVMPYPNTNDLNAMREHPDVVVLEQAGLNVGYLAYNTSKAPFTDVRVRKALNMAINQQAILDRVYQGTAVSGVNLIPPTMWSYHKGVRRDVYDPIAAKELLKEAGFQDGFSTDLWVMPVERAYNPNPKLMGEMIQSDLAAVGVRAEIKTYEWGEYYQRMTLGEYSMGLLGWTGNHSDPDYFFYNLLSCQAASYGGSNVAKFCDPVYDELVHHARKIANPLKRIPLYEQAQVIFKEQAPWFTIAYAKQVLVARKEVQNLRLDPFGQTLLYGVELRLPK